jgi:hypothetical protein
MSLPHVPYWMPEWVHPGPLFRSSKMEPSLAKALDDMENEIANAYYQSFAVDWSLLPSTGTRTVRTKNYLLPNGKGF